MLWLYLRQILSRDEIVGFEENFPQTALSRRIVLEVEPVEAVEGVVGVHVQRVDAQVIGGEAEGLEHLLSVYVTRATHADDTCVKETSQVSAPTPFKDATGMRNAVIR